MANQHDKIEEAQKEELTQEQKYQKIQELIGAGESTTTEIESLKALVSYYEKEYYKYASMLNEAKKKNTESLLEKIKGLTK